MAETVSMETCVLTGEVIGTAVNNLRRLTTRAVGAKTNVIGTRKLATIFLAVHRVQGISTLCRKSNQGNRARKIITCQWTK